MQTRVEPEWKGEDCFAIGGGASLRDFDFSWLKGRRTIGANDAFRLGPAICARAAFCDWKWWKVSKWELEKYAKAGGVVYSVCPDTARFNIDWLGQLGRLCDRAGNPILGISDRRDAVGFNHNTGACVVNLAYLLGCRRIFLLGFDMQASPKHRVTHWHNYRTGQTPQKSFDRFRAAFDVVAKDLAEREVQVFNVTDGDSSLECFRKITVVKMKEMAR